VSHLEARVNDLKTKLKEQQTLLKQSKISRDSADLEIVDLAEKIEKYKSQQLNVKSNKQYDALTREIENAEQRSVKLEKEMEILEGTMGAAKKDAETLSAQLEELSAEYGERSKELREVNKEHEKEELKLQLERYERIKKAKNGKAVVPIKRGACGGCFNQVPPQKILEIRQNSYMYMCERCGRILVSDNISGVSVVTTL
jgi:predicted  nucleic acid-binding Zn-ribbon protein